MILTLQKNAALTIMVGGEAEPVETVRPLLNLMGKTVKHLGANLSREAFVTLCELRRSRLRAAHEDDQSNHDCDDDDRVCTDAM